MYHIIYKTINLVNGKFYIGKHATTTLEFDGYLGSGKLLKQAVKKYGPSQFTRITLFEFTCPKQANDKEKEIITEQFLLENSTKCYNLHVGGSGGSTRLDWNDNGEPFIRTLSGDAKQRISSKIKNTATYVYANGVRKRLLHSHPDVISGAALPYLTNKSTYLIDGAPRYIDVNDPRVLSGEAVHVLSGKKIGSGGFKKHKCMFTTPSGDVVYLDSEVGMKLGYTLMNKNTSVYKYPNGNCARLPTDHPDVISKLAVSINAGRRFPTVECPYCKKQGRGHNMKRYHFDNCKFNRPTE